MLRWLDRLSEKYGQPTAVLGAQLSRLELQHEIARLIADAVVREARDLGPSPDKQERLARMRRRLKLKQSTDWFDQLILERWRLDETRRAAEQKAP